MNEIPYKLYKVADITQVADSEKVAGAIFFDDATETTHIYGADGTPVIYGSRKWTWSDINYTTFVEEVSVGDSVLWSANELTIVARKNTTAANIVVVTLISGRGFNTLKFIKSSSTNTWSLSSSVVEDFDDFVKANDVVSEAATPNTVVGRDAAGDVYMRCIVDDSGLFCAFPHSAEHTKSEADYVLQEEIPDLEEIREGAKTRMINVTYNELVALRDNGELKAGMQYRITDYMTTTVQHDTKSAGHQFDVIVTADTENTLNEKARACLHDGDTYFSENNANLEAWQIWYCLDNDYHKFVWADASGKGVIYRMIDEWNNDCPYDFKNIQFLNKHVVKSSADIKIKPEYLNSDGDDLGSHISIEYMICVNDRESTEYDRNIRNDVFISYGYEINPDGNEALCLYKTDVNSYPDEADGADPFFYVGQTYVYGELFELWKKAERTNYGKGDLVWYTGTEVMQESAYKYALTYPITTDIYIPTGELYTFNIFDGGETSDLSIYGGGNDKGCQQFAHDNKILPYINYQGSYELNNIVFNHDTDYDSIFYGVYGNEIGVNSYNLYFGNNSQNNKIGNDCYNIKFGNDCSKNVIRDNCFAITVGLGCESNTFNNYCYSIFIGGGCYNNFFDIGCVEIDLGTDSCGNTFGKDSYEIHLSYDAYSNKFDSSCCYIRVGGTFYNNSFNSGCANIYLGENVRSCFFGCNCREIWIRATQEDVPINTVSNIIFGDCCWGLSLQCEEGPEMGDLKNYTIVAGTSEIDEIRVFRNRNYETKIAYNSKGEVKTYCEADLIA